MARVKIQMPDEFLVRLSKLGSKTDEVAEKVLEAGGEVMLRKTKSNLLSVIGKDTKTKSRGTGQLVSALGLSKVRRDRDGNSDIKLGFAEPRKDGESNAKIANILEYGKVGQPAKPFLKPAQTAGKSECVEKMIETLKEEIDKI